MLQLNQKAEPLSAMWPGFWSQKSSPGFPASPPDFSLKSSKPTASKLFAPNVGVDRTEKRVRATKQFLNLQDLYVVKIR